MIDEYRLGSVAPTFTFLFYYIRVSMHCNLFPHLKFADKFMDLEHLTKWVIKQLLIIFGRCQLDERCLVKCKVGGKSELRSAKTVLDKLLHEVKLLMPKLFQNNRRRMIVSTHDRLCGRLACQFYAFFDDSI